MRSTTDPPRSRPRRHAEEDEVRTDGWNDNVVVVPVNHSTSCGDVCTTALRVVGHCLMVGCGLFIYGYLICGKVSFFSSHLYQPMVSTLSSWFIRNETYQTDKARIPLFVIVIPMLMAGMIASLCHVVVKDHHSYSRSRPEGPAFLSSCSRRFNYYPQRINAWFIGCINHQTNIMVLGIVYVPLFVYTMVSVAQKLPEASSTPSRHDQNDTVSEIANTFAITALLGMSFLLIPVATYSHILQYFTNTQPLGVQQRIHQALGCSVMIGVGLHVMLHVYRWYSIQQYQNVLSMLFVVPTLCWPHAAATADDHSTSVRLCPSLLPDDDDVTTTAASNDDCTCYGRVRNVMGTLASMALLIIALTTVIVPSFRRHYYRVFYCLHRILGPLVFLFVILHWNRSIIYLSGNILYYMAGTFPIWFTKNYLKCLQRSPQPTRTMKRNHNISEEHIHITSVERITSHHSNGDSQVMALTFETTKEVIDAYFQPGQHVKLHVPSISMVSHPFTINQVLTSAHELRVLFRCVGPFTKKLARALVEQDPAATTALPRIYMEGFYGPSNRLSHILHHHDHVMFLAGGIGITPYLSLLYNILQSSCRNVGSKKITFVWICRDPALVEYIKRNYFEPIVELLQNDRNNARRQNPKKIELQIHIHQTHQQQRNDGREKSTAGMRIPKNVSYTNFELELTNEQADDPTIDLHSNHGVLQNPGYGTGVPFIPSKFFPGPRTTMRGNFVSFTIYTFVVWPGLTIIWYIYSRYQSKGIVLTRALAPLAIFVYAYIISRGMSWLLMESPISRNRLWNGSGYEQCRKDSNHELVDIATINSGNCDYDATSRDDWNKAPSVELGSLHDPRLESSLWNGVKADNQRQTSTLSCDEQEVQIEKRTGMMEFYEGRPTVHQILRHMDFDCHRPGLFVCGPSTMMRDIRHAVTERCTRQCLHNHLPRIALYEETFEI